MKNNEAVYIFPLYFLGLYIASYSLAYALYYVHYFIIKNAAVFLNSIVLITFFS
jgi:hypothetical protein